MLHPLVCLQPLFRGCLVVTHVAKRCNRTSCQLSTMWFTAEGFCFLSRKSCLRLAFLRRVEGLGFLVLMPFFISLLLVSKKKEKLEPMDREKLKASPWLASAWQKSLFFFTHRTHFGFTSESVKLESCRKTCCHHFQFLLSGLSTSIRSNAAGTFCVVLVNPVPDINLGSTLWLAGSLMTMRECLGHP